LGGEEWECRDMGPLSVTSLQQAISLQLSFTASTTRDPTADSVHFMSVHPKNTG